MRKYFHLLDDPLLLTKDNAYNIRCYVLYTIASNSIQPLLNGSIYYNKN